MALSVLQHTSKEVASPNALAYGSNVGGAGSALWCCVYWNSATTTMSVSDSRNGAWTALGSKQVGAGVLAAWAFQFFVMLSPAAGATTVTATESAGTDTVGLAINEIGGFTGTPTMTGTPAYKTQSSAAPTSPTITTTIATAAILTADFPSGSESSVSGGFTAIVDGDVNWGTGGYSRDFVVATQVGLSSTYATTGGDQILGICAIGDNIAGVSAAIPAVPVAFIYMRKNT